MQEARKLHQKRQAQGQERRMGGKEMDAMKMDANVQGGEDLRQIKLYLATRGKERRAPG